MAPGGTRGCLGGCGAALLGATARPGPWGHCSQPGEEKRGKDKDKRGREEEREGDEVPLC